MANDVTMSAIAIAQIIKAIGAAGPNPAATPAGRTKIPARTVALMILEVSVGTPRARISFSSDCPPRSFSIIAQAQSADARTQRAIVEVTKVGLACSTMRPSHLEDYYAFLRFASVSTDDQYKGQRNHA